MEFWAIRLKFCSALWDHPRRSGTKIRAHILDPAAAAHKNESVERNFYKTNNEELLKRKKCSTETALLKIKEHMHVDLLVTWKCHSHMSSLIYQLPSIQSTTLFWEICAVFCFGELALKLLDPTWKAICRQSQFTTLYLKKGFFGDLVFHRLDLYLAAYFYSQCTQLNWPIHFIITPASAITSIYTTSNLY